MYGNVAILLPTDVLLANAPAIPVVALVAVMRSAKGKVDGTFEKSKM